MPLSPSPAEPSGQLASVKVHDLTFEYEAKGFTLRVPRLDVTRGHKVVFIGPSGSGKTTLLHLLAGILVPDAGRIVVEDEDVTAKNDAERRRFRIGTIGIIFQEFELLDHLTVRENVLLPYYVNRALVLDRAAEDRLEDLAASLGISGRLGRRPRRLSHGERQRVAVCRALVTGPRILMADEPTGNLDPRNTHAMMDLVFREVEEHDATFLMVTHDHSLLDTFDRVIDFQAFRKEAS